MSSKADLSWILNQLGEDRSAGYNAVVPPVAQSSNFAFPTVAAAREALAAELDRPFYTRGANPTVAILRQKIAALEGAEDALVLSSGSAAMAAAVMGCVQSGDHVICVRNPYTWTRLLLEQLLAPYGVAHTFVDGRDLENFRAAIKPNTRLIILESPNSMTFELQDLGAVATLARTHGILTICDNSYSSPLFQKPIGLGVDLVVHSATKYINGHSDVVAGIIAGSHVLVRRIMAKEFMTLGAVPSPHDAWLMLRGLRTLPLRMGRSADSAAEVAAFLEAHPKVERIHWPGAASHPQHALARQQMQRCAGLMSIELAAPDEATVERFCDNLQHFLIAVSWGGYESLQWPVCATKGSHLPRNLVRLYIGLEEPAELITDLRQALDRL